MSERRNRGFTIGHKGNPIGRCLRATGRVILAILRVALCLMTLCLALCLVAWKLAKPYVEEARATAYDKLCNIDSDYFTMNTNTLIYDKDGEVIGELNNSSFEYVEIGDVSRYVTDGYIAVEDRNFKTHMGIDPKAILRAALAYVKNRGEVTQGGSTITQQLVKNNILSSEQTIKRKLAEAFIAIDLEKRYTKSDIMEWYVNTCFYGNNNYGIGAASRYYFGVDASELSPAQAAILVGVSNAPSRYNPVSNYDRCIENARGILKTMLSEGVITQEQYDVASSEYDTGIDIVMEARETTGSTSYAVTYAVECATLELMRHEGFTFRYLFLSQEDEEAYRETYDATHDAYMGMIRNGGYEIHTSLDMGAQELLQETVDNGLAAYTEASDSGIYSYQGAAVCIDNSTGYVIAISGGRTGSGEYNRAWQSARQPGSSIKPLLDYGPALDTGRYNPGTVVEDGPVPGDYQPSNWYSGYRGNMTLRYALKQSVNTVAYKLLDDIGPANGMAYLEKMGFSSLDYFDATSSIASIGGLTNGVSPVEMARAYACLANGGLFSQRTCITRMASRSETICDGSGQTTRVYSEDTAYMLTDMMKDVVDEGTGTAASVAGHSVAGKTGTTNGNRDCWFAGYTRQYTATFWTGYDTPRDSSTGSELPASMFSSFMSQMCEGLPDSDWEKPSTVMEYDGDLVSASNNADYKNLLGGATDGDRAALLVKEFEGLSIKSAEDAVRYLEKDTEVWNAISAIRDEETIASLSKRVSAKETSLEKQYNEWAAELARLTAADPGLSASNKTDEEFSSQAAQASTWAEARDRLDQYILILSNAITYGPTEAMMLSAAQTEVNRLDGSQWHDDYQSKVSSILQRLSSGNTAITIPQAGTLNTTQGATQDTTQGAAQGETPTQSRRGNTVTVR